MFYTLVLSIVLRADGNRRNRERNLSRVPLCARGDDMHGTQYEMPPTTYTKIRRNKTTIRDVT